MQLTLGKKLIGSFLGIAILLVITSLISSYYLWEIDKSGTDLIDRRSVILSNIQKIQTGVTKESNSLRGYIMTQDQEFLTSLNTYYNDVSGLIDETLTIVQVDSFRVELEELRRANDDFKEKYDYVLKMVASNQISADISGFYMREVLPIGRALDAQAEQLSNEQLMSMKEESQKNSQLTDTAITNVMVLSILAIILALLIGYFCSRMISKPIVALAQAAEQITLGNLTMEMIQVKNRDEIGSLASSFNQMKESLRILVHEIHSSAEHVASASEELMASAEQSSKAAEMITQTIQEVTMSADQQSKSVHESVTAMNDMSSGIQQIASSAQVTSALSVETAQIALEGNQAIDLSVKQMDSLHQTMDHLASAVIEMEKSSQEIGQIVEVISGIAAQTNLLALNAAIEAARAGEQGRGFAVVADEVRKLAEQSSQSTEQIVQLVSTIKNHTHVVVESMEVGVKEVDEGIEVVHAAGKLFQEIKQNIDEVSNQVQEISAASQQMSASTTQVVHSMEEISEGSKTVAVESQSVSASAEEQLASMEEITSSTTSLSKMADELQGLVGQFKI